MSANEHKNQLPIPEGAAAEPEAAEVLSAWIVKGALHVSAQRTFEKPELWGMMLMDFARHASRMYAQQGVMTEREAMARITGVLSRQLGGGTDSGTTTFI